MLQAIFIFMLGGCIYFIFIFISSSVPRFSMKKSVNQLIKNKRPKCRLTDYPYKLYNLPT